MLTIQDIIKLILIILEIPLLVFAIYALVDVIKDYRDKGDK